MKEDELLTYVVDRARWARWKVQHIRNSKAGVLQGDPGFPDLVLVRNQHLVFVELKREAERLDDAQVAWKAALETAGAQHVVWRPSDQWAGVIERFLL